MSTLSGNAIKGEKGKKFQQLKINLCTGNKPSEPEQQQHKSNIQRKQHGMTSLGKVPTARRPTNLPSEKSEHSGNDPSINLVPSGGPGWGNKSNETNSTPPSLVQNASQPATVSVNNTPMPGTSQPVPHAQHYPPTTKMPPMAPQAAHVPVHHGHPPDGKTWAMMTHGDSPAPNFLAPQSPLFQHEFPSLSSSSETSSSSTPATAISTQKPATSTAADMQYGPGPSLRPQTEGSWIQGGSRPQGPAVPVAGSPAVTTSAPVRPMQPYPPHIGPDGARNNLVPSGVGVVPGGPGGPYPPPGMPQQHMISPQYGGMMPSFMLRGPYPGNFPPNFQASVKGVTRPPFPPYMPTGPHVINERFMPPNPGSASSKRGYDDEDVKIRSIIKEEDLNQMANIGNDIGWACQQDIDYNQKLKFSDDEDDDKSKENRTKLRGKTLSLKSDEKISEKKENEKENDFRSSKECLKDKVFTTENIGQEIRNAWQPRQPMISTPSAARYQIPANVNKFEDDEEDWQEKRRQKDDEMKIIIRRARERKEEEEKRFKESQRAAANLKLKQLEAEMFGSERPNKESKEPVYNNDADIDMLPDWEKEKFRTQNKTNDSQSADESKKAQNAAPVPVVKDASEFRELIQLGDRSTFVKKEKEREQPASAGFSRSFSNNMPPRFQNLNRQNSSGFSSASSSSQNSDSRRNVTQMSQFSNKSNSNFGAGRHRLESDSLSDKDKDWPQEDVRKDKFAVEERESESRFQRDSTHDRDYGFDRDDDRKYENKFNKEYDIKRKYYGEKGDYVGDSYNRDFDRENNYNSKFNDERKISENERNEKGKDYEVHRFSESENQEKESKWRNHSELPEKAKHFNVSTKVTKTFVESDNHEVKKFKEEAEYDKKVYGAEKDREYYKRIEGFNRDKTEFERGKDQERGLYTDFRNVEVENKREREHDPKKEKDFYKEQERKSPSSYEERLSRNDLRENRFHRESRETLRDDSYIIQEERAYSWADDADIEEKPFSRRDGREDRGDRYSHATRHIPGPVTREKLEAKELEAEPKRNLTALVRSDKKMEVKKTEAEEKKDKEKVEPTSADSANVAFNRQKVDEPIKSPWNREEKKDKDKPLEEAALDKNNEIKEKDETKEISKSSTKTDESASKSSDRRKNERGSKRSDSRGGNWPKHAVYRGSSYTTGRNDSKLRRYSKGTTAKSSMRRDSKYSESEYSDEISGSGREDKSSRSERDLTRPIKSSSKRYERDDRNYDYHMDSRDYMGSSRMRNHDYYYSKPSQRGRGGFRGSVAVGKRMDGYGPPPSKSPFSNPGVHPEDKRQKPIHKDSSNYNANEQNFSEKRTDTLTSGNKASTERRSSNSRVDPSEKAWKKSENASENKSTISSSTSTQTAEANEESFATASEGTDSDDNGGPHKSKQSSTGTKRQGAVLVTKQSRRNYRSTSGGRYEGRRIGSLHSRKDSGSYVGAKKSSAVSVGSKFSTGNKENEKGGNESALDGNFGKGDIDGKSVSEKSRDRDFPNNAVKKTSKPRNQSNSRKNIRSSGITTNNHGKSSQDYPARLQTKPKKSGFDTKGSGEYRDSKLDGFAPVFKEVGYPVPAPPPAVNAWDKPITGVLRTTSPSVTASNSFPSTSSTTVISSNVASAAYEKNPTQTNDLHAESVAQPTELLSNAASAEKASKVLENLDGSTPPVKTIIFENTNFKQGPSELSSKSKYNNQLKNHRYDKGMKLECLDSGDNADVANFNTESSNSELPNKHNSLQMVALAFNKNEDASDMKLDFTFDSEFSKLTDDNKTTKAMELTHAMHMVQSSTDADLNFKIASVKKVWDGSLVEHFDDKYDGGMVNTSTSFSPSFSSHATDPNSGACYVSTHVEAAHVQVDEVNSLGHNEVVFSPVSQIPGVASTYGSSGCPSVVMKNDITSSSSNVCKVKPQPQGCSATIGNVAQNAVLSPALVSQPPPLSSPSYSFSCSTPQPNLNNNAVPATPLQPINFQAPYSSMPPVPSPPVLYNSNQGAAPTPGVYQTFQIDNTQVPTGSQFNRYQTSYGLSSAIGQTSAFSQQSFVVQTPPSAPPEIFSSALPQYRIPTQPFGNTQQITSPSTVLISSTSNSLMSATIKPSNQQISAIGTKTGYPTAQTSQIIIPFDPNNPLMNQNFLPGSPIIQRPASNVVQAASIQPSTSYYTAGSGAGQTNFFQPGTNSAVQPQAGSTIGLTAFNAQSGTPSFGHTPVQNYNSQLTQQYRPASASYLKNAGNTCNISSDFGNAKTITLPNQHDALNSAFSAGSQVNAAKSRIQLGGKAPQTMQQALAQHNVAQNPYGYQASNQMRNNGGANKGSQFPHPIQRPVSHGNNSNRSGNNTSNSSATHRMPVRNNSHQLVNNIQQPPSSVYYTAPSGYNTNPVKLEASSLDSKTEANTDSKLVNTMKTITSKNVTGTSTDKNATTNE